MKKPKKRQRTPASKVNRRQRMLAIRTLEKILTDPSSPPHVKMGASRALLNDGKAAGDDAEFKAGLSASDEPRPKLILPSNCREPEGFVYDDYSKDVVVLAPTREQMPFRIAHLARLARMKARSAGETLALPAPVEP